MNINTFLEWLLRKIDIVAIILSLISLTLSIIGFVHSTGKTQKQEKWHKLKQFWFVRYSVFHAIAFSFLTVYILVNWEECISMQFFSKFDGNNILFLTWIVLIFLIIYEVEGKGIKVAKHKQEKAQQNLSDAVLQYKIDTMLSQTKSNCPNLDNTHQNKEGGQ